MAKPSTKRKEELAPRKSRGDDVVHAVLQAALLEAAERGYAAMRVEDVAARAQVNKTTIYRRWPHKRDLLAAALRWAGPQLADVPNTGCIEQDLRQFMELVSEMVQNDLGRCMMELMFGNRNDPEAVEIVQSVDREMSALPALIFERAAARGEIAPDLDRDVLLGALVGSFFARHILQRRPFDAAFRDQLARLLMYGACQTQFEPGERAQPTSGSSAAASARARRPSMKA